MNKSTSAPAQTIYFTCALMLVFLRFSLLHETITFLTGRNTYLTPTFLRLSRCSESLLRTDCNGCPRVAGKILVSFCDLHDLGGTVQLLEGWFGRPGA